MLYATQTETSKHPSDTNYPSEFCDVLHYVTQQMIGRAL